jgi:tRNA U34 5-methylaminomethyl-2-thiouridine-forming methyltransferase MnmC
MKVINCNWFPLATSANTNTFISKIINPKTIFYSAWYGIFNIQRFVCCFRLRVTFRIITIVTSLNTFITFHEASKTTQIIDYVGVEAYPVSHEEVLQMNYVSELNALQHKPIFEKMHDSEWEEKIEISEIFTLTKRNQFFKDITDKNAFDLIYFDAFGYRVQPELWSTEIFKIMYDSLNSEGILVTYAARGVVKRSMIEVGFTVEKLPGPPGKRDMFRATKRI